MYSSHPESFGHLAGHPLEATETWPRSLAFWLVVGWLALFIIRPWEIMFPWLEALRFERVYVLSTFSVILASGRLRFLRSTQTNGILLLVGALLITAIVGIEPEKTIDSIWRYIILLAFYVAVVSVVRSPLELYTLCFAFLGIYAAYLTKSEWEYFVHGRRDYAVGAGISRLIGIDSTFGSANAVGASAAVTLPWLSLSWILRNEFPAFATTQVQRRLKWGLAVYFCIAVLAIVLTNSRAGMLGALLALFLVSVAGRTLKEKKKALAAVAVICVITWLMMPEMHRNRFRSIWDSSAGSDAANYSAHARTRHFSEGWDIFTKYPITGVGIGSNRTYRGRTRAYGDRQELHNLYAKMLADTGMLGTTAFIFFLLPVFSNHRQVEKLSRLNPDIDLTTYLAVTRTASITILLMLFLGLTGNNLGRVQWVFAASLAVLSCRFAMEKVAALHWLPEDAEIHHDNASVY